MEIFLQILDRHDVGFYFLIAILKLDFQGVSIGIRS